METKTQFDMDELINCMHCGFCLPACPTYQQTGQEMFSPRGRIALMKSVAEGKLNRDDETFAAHVDACLGCRACETACPAGVEYGQLIETARTVVAEERALKRAANGAKPLLIRRLVFDGLFSDPKRMQQVGSLVWFAQATGLQKLVNQTGLIRMFPKGMRDLQRITSRISSPAKRRNRPTVYPLAGLTMRASSDSSTAVLRVGLFTGCVMDVMFFETNRRTAELLSRAGCEVMIFPNQNCCGALHAHSGEMQGARDLAKQNIEAVEKADLDFVVNNAGGCGAALKEYHHWFKDDSKWEARAEAFVSKMKDFSEILEELPPIQFTKQVHRRVTYQDSCHLAHGQGIRKHPRRLIQSVPGVDYVEMQHADTCCGSAGIYNIVQPEMASQVLSTKMDYAERTAASVIVTANPGCLMQMKLGIEERGLSDKVEAVHIVDFLYEAL